MTRLGGLVAAALVVGACAAGEPTVERWVDGRVVEGRFIDSDAYAAYGAAVLLEARSDDRGALALYRRALASDPDSVEILTRVAAVLCRLGSRSEAASTFDQARGIDPTYAPRLREEARCRLKQGQVRQALELGLAAVALDPEDDDASIVVAQAYAADGDRAAARRWLEALALFRPEQGRRTLGGRESESGRQGVDLSLVKGLLAEARQRARRAGIGPAELALRAVALGRADLGAEQAELVIGADPRSADAWVAGLVAADLRRDEVGFQRMLGAVDREANVPGPLGSCLLAELLARRVSARAARAWLDARGPLSAGEPPGDVLLGAVMARARALTAGE